MTKETIDLRFFDKGLYSSIDPMDIPDEGQVEGSYNLDVDAKGRLQGIKSITNASSYGGDGIKFGWIERNTGEWDLIYTNGTDTKVIYDFYGTQSHATLISGSAFETIISNNQEVHLGMGKDSTSKWIGYISHGQFGGSAPSGLQIEDAQPTQPSGSHSLSSATATTTVTEENAVFPKGVEYQYKFSFIYDGYQESPLGGVGTTKQITGYYTQLAMTLTIANYATLNDRITGVRVYRRERPFYDSTLWTNIGEWSTFIGNLNASNEQLNYKTGELGSWGEYKLIDDIDINDSSWATSSTSKTISVVDTNDVGVSYYQNVGIQEENYYTTAYYGLDYGLATTVNNYLFATNATHQRLPDDDSAHTIFRSKKYRLDTFDWANDKMVLPTIPKAMASHRGLLYVWDENTTYIIEPNQFQIIKTIKGRGCSSQQSVVETDYGLFWANENGAFWSTQTEELIKPTKDNLTENIVTQYQTAVSGVTPKLVYNSTRSQLLIHVGNYVFAYRPVEGRWDYYQPYSGTVKGAFIGKDGETYVSLNTHGIYQDFAIAARKAWTFISKDFTLDDPSQDKKFYKITSTKNSGTNVYYSTNSGSTWTLADTSQFNVRSKTFRIKVTGLAGTTYLSSLSITFRRLRGK